MLKISKLIISAPLCAAAAFVMAAPSWASIIGSDTNSIIGSDTRSITSSINSIHRNDLAAIGTLDVEIFARD